MARNISTPRKGAAAFLRLARRPGRLGPLGFGRLIAIVVVHAVVLILLVQTMWLAITGVVLGVLAVAGLLGRHGDRWWTDRIPLAARFWRRRKRSAQHSDDPRLSAVRALVPDVTVEDIPDWNGAVFGMGSDGAGWFAVHEILVTHDTVQPPVPLAQLFDIAGEATQFGASVQVVGFAADRPGNPELGKRHAMWIAIRLDSRAVADSTLDGENGEPDVPDVLRELSRRTHRVLEKTGLRSRLLDADELLDALVLCCDLAPGNSGEVGERWKSWNSVRLAHSSFWLKRWPELGKAQRLIGAVHALPVALVSVAFQLVPDGENGTLRCLIRVGEPSGRHEQACADLSRTVTGFGGQLMRLNGEQAVATYLSAPSGGMAR
ncbi:type VII secretion protein EccE [Saccharomonospora sp. NPDC006951]